jgi:2-polyprenyl-6-methoxyphenol hydroxylase-like FAD-dependent oxidoreductase
MVMGAEGSLLRERLRSAEQDDTSRCAIGGLDLGGRLPSTPDGLCVGDALTMIPPITGNGMSMALESAALAQPQLERYSRGTLSWVEACQLSYATAKRVFSSRLRWGCWLHRLACNAFLQRLAAVPMLNSELLWRWWFERTR